MVRREEVERRAGVEGQRETEGRGAGESKGHHSRLIHSLHSPVGNKEDAIICDASNNCSD